MHDTFKGYVAPWECDEMGHMNIQFFADKFSQSLLRHLFFLGENSKGTPGTLRALHMRFHKELHASDLAAAHGEVSAFEKENGVLTHFMRNEENGALAATASFHLPLEKMPDEVAPLANEAAPRGLTPGLLFQPGMEAHEGLTETNLSAVRGHECSAEGGLSLKGYFSRLSDCQGHMWRLAGLGRQEQKARGLATATVELHFQFFGALGEDDLIAVHTGLDAVGSKTLHYRHIFFNGKTGAPVAAADGIGLLFDKETRRAIALPEAVRESAAYHRL